MSIEYDQRVKALELAIASQERPEAPEQVVARADAFLAFLKTPRETRT